MAVLLPQREVLFAVAKPLPEQDVCGVRYYTGIQEGTIRIGSDESVQALLDIRERRKRRRTIDLVVESHKKRRDDEGCSVSTPDRRDFPAHNEPEPEIVSEGRKLHQQVLENVLQKPPPSKADLAEMSLTLEPRVADVRFRCLEQKLADVMEDLREMKNLKDLVVKQEQGLGEMKDLKDLVVKQEQELAKQGQELGEMTDLVVKNNLPLYLPRGITRVTALAEILEQAASYLGFLIRKELHDDALRYEDELRDSMSSKKRGRRARSPTPPAPASLLSTLVAYQDWMKETVPFEGRDKCHFTYARLRGFVASQEQVGDTRAAEEEGIQEERQVAEEEGIQEERQVAQEEGIQEERQVAEEEGIQEERQVAEEEGIQEEQILRASKWLLEAAEVKFVGQENRGNLRAAMAFYFEELKPQRNSNVHLMALYKPLAWGKSRDKFMFEESDVDLQPLSKRSLLSKIAILLDVRSRWRQDPDLFHTGVETCEGISLVLDWYSRELAKLMHHALQQDSVVDPETGDSFEFAKECWTGGDAQDASARVLAIVLDSDWAKCERPAS